MFHFQNLIWIQKIGKLKFESSKNMSNKYYGLMLDKHLAKTFYKNDMLIPSFELALAMAEEWSFQKKYINT